MRQLMKNEIGNVIHIAMSTGYHAPYETLYHWCKNIDYLCNLCHQTGVQFHTIGGVGAQLLESQGDYNRGHFKNGYFRVKKFQHLLVQKYYDAGMYGCNYDAPYIIADVEDQTTSLETYSHGMRLQLFNMFGVIPICDFCFLSASMCSKIILKHMVMIQKNSENSATYMNLYTSRHTYREMARILDRKVQGLQQIHKNIVEQYGRLGKGIISQFDMLTPDWSASIVWREFDAPQWVQDMIKSRPQCGEPTVRKYVRGTLENFDISKYLGHSRDLMDG